MEVVVRPCTGADLEALRRAELSASDRRHHEERWAMQRRGEALYLLAWRDHQLVGCVTLLHRSKYDEVRRLLGDFPEMNALAAHPTNEGIGTTIIRSAEESARTTGAARIGLAVGDDNAGALRLYERLGYADWRRGHVVDRWTEYGEAGQIGREHASPCRYMVKDLASDT